MKKNRTFLRSFAKEQNVLVFFPVLYKRTKHSLRSFPFFAKEQEVLYVLSCSFEKNGKARSVLLGLVSRQKLKKRTGKNGTFFNRTEKTEHSERERTRSPSLKICEFCTTNILYFENLMVLYRRSGGIYVQIYRVKCYFI